jgi:hypothetical protein
LAFEELLGKGWSLDSLANLILWRHHNVFHKGGNNASFVGCDALTCRDLGRAAIVQACPKFFTSNARAATSKYRLNCREMFVRNVQVRFTCATT